MKEEREEYIQAILDLEGDVEGRKQALRFIEDSDVYAYGAPAPFPYVPYLFNADDMAFVTECCHTIHRILVKVIDRFLEDPEYRTIFHFTPEEERLILLPCNYEQRLPMGRFDFFLDEGTRSFKFCEFNTDGSGAMSRDFMIATALEHTPAFKRFAEHHRVSKFELFDSWVEAFMRIYRTDRCAVETPSIAVIDFAESGVFSDFNRFIEAFKRAGYPARFTDIRDLVFDGEHLRDRTDGTVIDAIYRRSVTSEILQHPGECEGLFQALEAEKVCLIGHFRTTVVHSKMVNIALFDERTRAMLTDEENGFVAEHVPRTFRLRRDAGLDLDAIKGDRSAWIIKPEDDYGSHGVYPGIDMTDEAWACLVDDKLDQGCIIQEYYHPAYVDVVQSRIPEDGDVCKVEKWQSMPGFYQYDGEPVGFYCRLGNEGIIAIDHGGLCACSFKVDC